MEDDLYRTIEMSDFVQSFFKAFPDFVVLTKNESQKWSPGDSILDSLSTLLIILKDPLTSKETLTASVKPATSKFIVYSKA